MTTGPADGFGASAMNGLVWFVSDVEQGRITAVDAETGEHVRDLDVVSRSTTSLRVSGHSG